MEKKKVVFFTGSMGRGGAERVISIIANQLSKRGWDVTIVMLLHNITDGYKLNENVKLESFVLKKKKFLAAQILYDICKIKKFIKREKPQVVISFMRSINFISWIACKGKKVRYIASERNDPAKSRHGLIFERVLYSAYENAEVVIFQTERAKRCFNEKIQNNGIVIGNPVSITCDAEKEKKKKIVAVGRLERQKNHKMLIGAFAEVVKKHPDYILEIYGEGSLRQSLQMQIDKLKLNENVYLKGAKEDIHNHIKDAAAFVLPSDFEGTSNALLEAMLMGIPCISTDCAGSDEVIVNGENGLLVPVGNEEKMTKAIMKLIEDEELREKFAMNGKKSVERFKTSNIINQWIEVIS